MQRRTQIGAAVAIAALGGAVALVAAAAGSERASVTTHVDHRRAALRGGIATSPSLAPTLEIGVEHAYDVSIAQAARSDGAARPELSVSIAGTWAVAYAGSDERGAVFRAQLRDAKPAVRRGDTDTSAAFTTALARPYYFTTTTDGRLIALHFAADVDALTRGALGALAATFQRSQRSQAAAWDAIESDSLGDYRAHYSQAGNVLHRDRVAYERVAGDGAIAATIVKTGTDITLRDDGWPEDLGGSETTRIGTKDVGVIVDARFSLRHRSIARIDAGWPRGLDVVAVDAATGAAAAAARADRELVDGATLPDLLAELARLDAGDARGRGLQFLRIAALLRLDERAARAAGRAVLDGTAGANAPVLISALGEAGTPQAQKALGELISAPAAGGEARMRASIALGLTAAPTAASLDVLAQEAARDDGDASASALLAQGNAALRIRDDDPAAAARQVDALLARFARATSDEERALVLRALGNTGDPRIMAALDVGLASDNAIVRVAATEALRLVPGDAIDALVLARLQDPVGFVRAAAVFAAGDRALAGYAVAFDQVVRHDADVTVRRAIVELAGARSADLPASRALLEYVATHDADAELRDTARQLLATPSAPS